MSEIPDWLPPMLCLRGSWDEIVGVLYSIFMKDFKEGKPQFKGCSVWWDQRILPGSRYEEGFWHLITREDRNTKERLPDFRRAERLPWCAPVICNCTDCAVKVWDYRKPKGMVRTYLWLERLDYVVVLQKRRLRRGEVAFLITAFHVDGPSTVRWLNRTYTQRCQ